jgi:hypothetical protein
VLREKGGDLNQEPLVLGLVPLPSERKKDPGEDQRDRDRGRGAEREKERESEPESRSSSIRACSEDMALSIWETPFKSLAS